MVGRIISKVLTFLIVSITLAAMVSAIPPTIGGIPTQSITCGQQFAPIDLSLYTQDPDTPFPQLSFNSFDGYLFQVSISGGIATITYTENVARTEKIGFRVTDPEHGSGVAHVSLQVRCDRPVPNQMPPVGIPHGGHLPIIPGPMYEPVPFLAGYQAVGFFPDNFVLHPPTTCAISTGRGLLQDLDCDHVPGQIDNCPSIFNPDQADQNRNGVGDVCDIYVGGVETMPNVLACGRAMVVKGSVVNNAGIPFGPVKAVMKMDGANVVASDHINVLEPGSAVEVELTSRIPISAGPGSYNLVFEVEYGVGSMKEKTGLSKTIKVEEGLCGETPEDSFIKVQEIQDVKPGEKALFPIKITNTENRANSYIIQVMDVGDFGTYTLEPGSLVIVGAGQQETVYLNVFADSDVEEGARSFVFEVRQGEDIEQVVLVANVLPAGEESREMTFNAMAVGLVVSVLFIIIVFLVFSKGGRPGLSRKIR